MSKKMEEEGHTDSGKGLPEEHTKERIVCPVCGKVLYRDNLPDKESIIEDNLYHVVGVLIKNCTVLLHCDFEHLFKERDITIDDPHELVAVVSATFDGSGECVQFEIVEVCQDEGGEIVEAVQKEKELCSALQKMLFRTLFEQLKDLRIDGLRHRW